MEEEIHQLNADDESPLDECTICQQVMQRPVFLSCCQKAMCLECLPPIPVPTVDLIAYGATLSATTETYDTKKEMICPHCRTRCPRPQTASRELQAFIEKSRQQSVAIKMVLAENRAPDEARTTGNEGAGTKSGKNKEALAKKKGGEIVLEMTAPAVSKKPPKRRRST